MTSCAGRLEEAWKNVAANHGTAGIDNQTIEDIRAYGTDRFLRELQQELINETYTVSDVRRVFIQNLTEEKGLLEFPQ